VLFVAYLLRVKAESPDCSNAVYASTTAESYLSISVSPGDAEEHAMARKSAKYSSLSSSNLWLWRLLAL